MQYFVGTRAVASVLDVNESWVRNMVAKKVVFDTRTRKRQGSRLVFSVQEMAELYIACLFRKMKVGLGTIYEAVDAFNEQRHDSIVYYSNEHGEAVGVFVDSHEVMMAAARLWQTAYEYQYGGENHQHHAPLQ